MPSPTCTADFEAQLFALEAKGRLRRLIPRSGHDFSSNDYLGLAGDPMIAAAMAEALARGVPHGSGGSRLLRGNAPEHEALEVQAALHFHSEAALAFSNGFAANSALLAALPGPSDLIVIDALAHASMHDGLRLARAPHRLVAHNEPQAFEDAITHWRAAGGMGHAWIAIETLYSMDGDMAPLADLAEVAARQGAMLILDEAHATGAIGPAGRGLGATLEGHPHVIALHTCGKALGVEGALVTGTRAVIDLLINRARPFIFSTAPSPLMAVGVSAALNRVAAGDDLRSELAARVAAVGRHICAPLGLPEPRSHIVPVILGDDRRTMAAAECLQAKGFDVRGIRPPTVPAGTARLRLSVTCNVDEAIIARLGVALQEALA
jgi:8-amino-7-oxononanoate synthase